jgi:hypothetical protein
MKNIIYLNIIFFLLVSCGGLKEAGKVMRNEKISSTDEFLVKKRGPLVYPPDYEDLPLPEQEIKNIEEGNEKIKKILKAPDENTKINNKSSSIEESILDQIRK